MEFPVSLRIVVGIKDAHKSVFGNNNMLIRVSGGATEHSGKEPGFGARLHVS